VLLRKHKNTTFVDEKLQEHTEIIEYAASNDLQTVYTHNNNTDNQCKLLSLSYDIELEKEKKSKQLN
jgi:hypothetical protein